MDFEEKSMTALIREMIKAGLIFVADRADEVSYKLGPNGMAIAKFISSFIRKITSGAKWEDLKKANSFQEVIKVVLGVAGEVLIENVEILIKLALRVAEFIQRLFKDSQHKHSSYLKAELTN